MSVFLWLVNNKSIKIANFEPSKLVPISNNLLLQVYYLVSYVLFKNVVLMKRLFLLYSFLLVIIAAIAQSVPAITQVVNGQTLTQTVPTDSVKAKTEKLKSKHGKHRKFIQAADTLSASDYMLSIERVNDNLNSIRDSVKLGFEIVNMGRRLDYITKDINRIRQNIRDRHSVINIRNLYLYQSFASELDEENDRIQARLNKIYKKVYHSKLRMKKVLNDSVFRALYADSTLRNTFDNKLVRLERKWTRTDSITKLNVDSLNALKVKASDNSMTLSNMLNMMDTRLDKAGQQLFGQEVNYLWQPPKPDSIANDSTKKTSSFLGSEQKAIGYYISQTWGKRITILLLGILLFLWLFLKRKLLKNILIKKESFEFLHLQYLNAHPVLSILLLLLCLMPFFDAYAPTSYIAIEYFLLLAVSSSILLQREDRTFRLNWLALLAVLLVNMLTYLLAEPTFLARVCMLVIQAVIIIFSIRFYKKLDKQRPYYSWIRIAAIISATLSVFSILFNVFGRFSLSGIVGISGIIALTQVIVLTVFVEIIIEIILVQLQGSRLKKGIDKAFDASLVVKKIKIPLVILAVIIWLIMLTSNLNIYHSLSQNVVDMLTSTRTIGSISFQLISVILFFAIIWLAHILQRLISFLFGETGMEPEDLAPVTKGQHSRLLITRLLVLIGGYLLAIAASGLPIDKLTFLLGALGVGIGMGLQAIVNNFVSGIILIFDGSLQIGDEIEVSGQAGKVKEIGLRASTLNTADGAEVIIPNGSILSQNIVNWTYSNDQKRVTLAFSLSGEELDANVINEVINDTMKVIPSVIAHRKPVILYTKVTPESCSLTIRFWSTISKVDQVKSEMMLQLSTAFAAKKIGFE